MLVKSPRREEAIKTIGLPQGVLQMTKGEVPHDLLKDDCRDVRHVYDWDSYPDGADVVPLWSGHSSVTGFRLIPDGVEFVKYEIEYPNELEVLGTSIFSVITDLFIWFWREADTDEAILRELALLLDYPVIDRFLTEIEATKGQPRNTREDWETAFKHSL